MEQPEQGEDRKLLVITGPARHAGLFLRRVRRARGAKDVGRQSVLFRGVVKLGYLSTQSDKVLSVHVTLHFVDSGRGPLDVGF